MRKLSTFAAACSAITVVVAPIAAQAAPANPAASLSVAKAPGVRASTATKKSSGIGAGVILPIIIVAAVGTMIGFSIDDDGSEPDSN